MTTAFRHYKNAYARRMRAEQQAGTWHRFVDAQPVRNHILHLRAHGVGRGRLARRAKVSETTVYRIVARNYEQIHCEIAAAILAVNPEDIGAHLIDATGARRRVQALGADGHSQTHIARRLGWAVNNLNAITSGRRRLITPETHDAVCRVYEQLLSETPPTGAGYAYARTNAKKHGWHGPEYWTPATIDDPKAIPELCKSTEPDWVVVERVVAGRAQFSTAAQADRDRAVAKLHAMGVTQTSIAKQLRTSNRVVKAALSRAAA